MQRLEAEQTELSKFSDIIQEAPEEFFDELTNELMSDPVKLPNSGQILDRTTIEKALARSQVDPYDKTPLTADQLIPRRRSGKR